MNLEEALKLRARAKREVKQAREFEDSDSDRLFGSDLPRLHMYVATEDGLDFFFMYFSGEYSEYGETVVQSEEEWDKLSVEWKQIFFNPDGEWSRRQIVRIDDVPPRASRHISTANEKKLVLECGHTQGVWRYSPEEDGRVGDRIVCYYCRKEGWGLTPEMVAAQT